MNKYISRIITAIGAFTAISVLHLILGGGNLKRDFIVVGTIIIVGGILDEPESDESVGKQLLGIFARACTVGAVIGLLNSCFSYLGW